MYTANIQGTQSFYRDTLCPKNLDSDVKGKKNHRKPLTPEQILSSNVSPEMIGVRGYPQINLGISKGFSVSLRDTFKNARKIAL